MVYDLEHLRLLSLPINMSSLSDFKVRPAVQSDCEEILRLIRELAEFANHLEKVDMTVEVLSRDGFGEHPFFHCLVVEDIMSTVAGTSPVLVGYALYYDVYSTWNGRVLYLEDMYMSPAYRGMGIRSRLFKSVAEIGVANECARMQWMVVGSNKPAIAYYKARGAWDVTTTENLRLFQMDKDHVEQLATS